MASESKYLREVDKIAAEFGAAVTKSKRGHLHLRCRKTGHLLAVAALTPSDHRTIQNLRRDLRNRKDHHP